MALIGTASRVYGGSTQATKVYTGSTLVWPLTPLAAKLVFPGVVGNRLSTPSTTALQVTDDLEIVAYVDPTAGGGWQTVAMDMVNKYLTTGSQRSYRFYVGASGTLTLALSGDGITPAASTSSVAIAAASPALWIKVTRAAGVVKFYTAPAGPTEPTTWTQLGVDRTTTITGTLLASTASVCVGDLAVSGTPYKGRIYRTIIRSGIGGTTVFDMSEDNANANVPTSFVCTTGQTMTAIQTAGNTIIQPRVP